MIAAGGVALGVLGSRLLAPLAAMGSGALPGQAGGDPFDLLEEDHRIILSTLRDMEQDSGAQVHRDEALIL